MPRAQFCKSRAFAYNNAFKELFSLLPTLIWAVATCHEMCAILQGWTFFCKTQTLKNVAQKMCKTGANWRKQVQTGANPKNVTSKPQTTSHEFLLVLSEHSDTICREKCETTVRKNPWRADFSKTSTFSFTSVNLHFRAKTQRHLNLRYFGGPRSYWSPPFSRMRSKGSRFTLGVWGLSCVRQTLRNRPPPFATARKCPREVAMAVPMGSSATGVTFGCFQRRIASFRMDFVTFQHVSWRVKSRFL